MDCSFPLPALPAMRTPMLQLQQLELGLAHAAQVNSDTFSSVLVLLCRPHPEPVQLRHVACCGCPPAAVDRGYCTRSVVRQLEEGYGVAGVTLTVL